MSGSNSFKWAFLLISVTLVSAASIQNVAECDPDTCKLPDCQCSLTGPDLLTSATPQLVFLSFDAAVNIDNFGFYQDVIFGRKNPNGQPITATFFVTHDYTNYSMLHELYRRGHEIGLHSISGNPAQAYWQGLDAAGWRQELVDQRQQFTQFARIPTNQIVGARAPQLILGGDDMYSVLSSAKITYDSSRPTFVYRQQGIWPYTNDYLSKQDCETAGTCPEQAHPGFWSVPIIDWVSGSSNRPCSLADQCLPLPTTPTETFNLLMRNFETHYNGNRAPFNVFTRHGWVNGTEDPGTDHIWQRRLGYIQFLDHLATLPNVYIVSIARGLEWVRDPTPLANVANFPSFQVEEKASQCPRTFSCYYGLGETPFKPPLAVERYFYSCTTCPRVYPWVGNHLGLYPYE